MAIIPQHLYMIRYQNGIDEHFCSYILNSTDRTRGMEVDVPPASGMQDPKLAQWLEQHKTRPPPTHSPAMLVHTNSTKWRRGYDWRYNSPVRARGYSAVPTYEVPYHDDASDDSYKGNGNIANKPSFTRNTNSPGAAGDYLRGATVVRFQSPSLPRHAETHFQKHQNNGGFQRNRQRTFRSRTHSGSPDYIPPDRFLSHGNLVHVDKNPSHINSTDQMSKNIWNMFMMNQQTIKTYEKKILLWKDLFVFMRSTFPKFGLFMVGSTMSGLGTNTSDVDMCLLVRCSETDQRSIALLHLSQIAIQLRHSDIASHADLIHAKVPILKLKTKGGLEVDLNCNNAVGIRNTHLLYCYAQMDWRVRPLVVVVKLWASRHNINDAKRMTVSSYSWALMVIHYLQCGVTPNVLPCLQKEYRDKFSAFSDISHIDLHEELPPFRSENKESLAQLLQGFLQYYKDFEYNEYAVSVRVADRVPVEECRHARTLKNDPTQWKYLCIEEPFDLTNTARSVYDYQAFERVRRVVQASCERLKSTKRLDSLFERNFQPL